jgi:hypothetical protein
MDLATIRGSHGNQKNWILHDLQYRNPSGVRQDLNNCPVSSDVRWRDRNSCARHWGTEFVDNHHHTTTWSKSRPESLCGTENRHIGPP